jgi:prephenate dehydrogenase
MGSNQRLAVTGVTRMLSRVGMRVVTMSADPLKHPITHRRRFVLRPPRRDLGEGAPARTKVLAVTSHVPHLIACTIVGTATDLEDSLKSEVIEFSASRFRDFTRIAASDPVMWRGIFLNNREAVLEILQRFNEDLTALQRAIRWGEGDKLQELFTRTRAIRRSIIEAKQA